MAIFLNTTGERTLGVGICDRCGRKFPLGELHPDPNAPGLRVCEDDIDDYDPYRLEARQADRHHLKFVRPDVDISLTAAEAAASTPTTPTDGVWAAGVWAQDTWGDDVWEGIT